MEVSSENRNWYWWYNIFNIKYADIFEEEISGVPGTVDTKNSCILKLISKLDNFYIEENYRGQGIGTKLVNEFKKYCLDKGK